MLFRELEVVGGSEAVDVRRVLSVQLDVLDGLLEFFVDIVLSFVDLNLGSVQHVHHFDVGRVY